MASEQGHTAFACGCHIARARGATSCLDRFGEEQFRRWHKKTPNSGQKGTSNVSGQQRRLGRLGKGTGTSLRLREWGIPL